MALPQVLIIGSEAVDKHGLAGRIIGRPLADTAALSAPWSIDNKYYRAEVELQLAHLEAAAPGAGGAEEAVVMVFDAARPDTFAGLQRWWESAAEGGADPAVKLAVAVGPAAAAAEGGTGGAAAGGQQPAWLQGAQDWCAEQLIEYVEVGGAAAASPPDEEEGGEGGHGEAEGVQRIVEALHAHTWPGLQLKPRGGGGGGRAASSTVAQPSAGPQENGVAAAGAGREGGSATQAAAGAQQRPQLPRDTAAVGGLELGDEPGEELDLIFAELAGLP